MKKTPLWEQCAAIHQLSVHLLVLLTLILLQSCDTQQIQQENNQIAVELEQNRYIAQAEQYEQALEKPIVLEQRAIETTSDQESLETKSSEEVNSTSERQPFSFTAIRNSLSNFFFVELGNRFRSLWSTEAAAEDFLLSNLYATAADGDINDRGTNESGPVTNAVGAPDGNATEIGASNDYVVLTLADELPMGTDYTLYIGGRDGAATAEVWEAPDGTTLPSSQQNSPSGFTQNGTASSSGAITMVTKTAAVATKFIYLQRGSGDILIDAVEYCLITCAPTNVTAMAMATTCSGTPPNAIANMDASVVLNTVTDGDRYHIVSDGDFTGLNAANALLLSTIGSAAPYTLLSGLANPGSAVTYTIRVYNGNDDACVTEVTTVLRTIDCNAPFSCDCKEYIYLNEPFAMSVLKFEVTDASNFPLTNLTGPNGVPYWYPGTTTSELPSPHGFGTDLNGNIYIGDENRGANIRKFNCDGQIEPIDATTIVNENPDGSDRPNQNFFSIDNTLYVNTDEGPTAYDLCTGQELGQACLNGSPAAGSGTDSETNLWGLSYNSTTEMVYATQRRGQSKVWTFTRAELEASVADATGSTCIDPLILESNSVDVNNINVGDMFLPSQVPGYYGIAGDNNGNFYVVHSSVGPGNAEDRILKYDKNGAYLAKTIAGSDATDSNPLNNFARGLGVTWSEETNILFLANNTDDPDVDCITAFDAATMASLGTAAPNPGLPTDNRGKAIAINKECCPENLPPAFERTIPCGSSGETFFLNEEAFPSCDGIVCGSSWNVVSLNGATFEPCNNSVTVTGTGCSVFSLDISAVVSTNCPAQGTTFTICFDDAPTTFDTPTTAQGDCTNDIPNDNATITISNIANADVVGVSSAGATTYNGSDYDATAAASDLFLVAGGSVTITGLEHAEDYIVRLFNQSSTCAEDIMVTTATIDCSTACPIIANNIPVLTAATCQGSTNNIDAQVSISNIVNGVRAGISTVNAAAYDGPDFATIGTNNITAGTITFTGLEAVHTYIIRIFTDANCFEDIMITTTAENCVTCVGNATSVIEESGVTDAHNALGMPDDLAAELNTTGNLIVLKLTDQLNAAVDYTIRWRRSAGTGGNPQVIVEESADGVNFTQNGGAFTVSNTAYADQTITTAASTMFIRITSQNVFNLDIDAISYSTNDCNAGVVGLCPDGIADVEVFTLDYETDDAGNALVAGTSNINTNQPYANIFGSGMGITVVSSDPTNNPMNIFNSAGTTGPDPDLQFGSGWSGGNIADVMLGNLLIVNDDADISTPDDEANGVEFTLTSDMQLSAISLDIVDLEGREIDADDIIRFENTVTSEIVEVPFQDFEASSSSILSVANLVYVEDGANRIANLIAEELADYAATTASMTDSETLRSFNRVTFITDASLGIGNICVKKLQEDYGDLADNDNSTTGTGNYNTLNNDGTPANDGPSHIINANIKLGATVDADPNGQPSADAGVAGTTGDDGDGTDDEDGVTLPANLTAGAMSVTLDFTLMNMTGEAAKLYGFIDFNNDGDFDETNEIITPVIVADEATSAQLVFDVPADAAIGADIGVRFRLTTDMDLMTATDASVGQAVDGEVEDYIIQVVAAPVLGAIGNYVWFDEDSNGFQDEGEAGIPNVVVILKDDNNVEVARAITDKEGGYLFPDLEAGTYFVQVDETSLPTDSDGNPITQTNIFTNVVDSDDADLINDDGDFGNKNQSGNGYQIVLDEGEENLTADFGYNYNPTGDVNNDMNTATLGDRVWIDTDGDGRQDPQEIGVEGAKITLSTNYEIINGLLDIDGDGMIDADDDGQIVDENGNPIIVTDGVIQTISINVLIDTDGDGTKEPIAVLAGGGLDLDGNNVLDDNAKTLFTPIDMAMTDANGFYIFDGLPTGAYTTEVTDDTGASEPILGNTYTQTGDPDDFAEMATNPDNRQTDPIILGPGDVFLNSDYGYQPNNAAQLGSIGNTIWLDADADGNGPSDVNADAINGAAGTPDDNEEGIAGVTVALVKDVNNDGTWDIGEPIISTSTTDTNGQYLFDGLPLGDSYLVVVTDTDNILQGLKSTYDVDGGTDPTGVIAPTALNDVDPTTVLGISAVPTLGQNTTPADVSDQDFGYTPENQDAGEGLIGDTVYFDEDGDGMQDMGEEGIEGVVVRLVDENNNIVAETTTDENGNYYFPNLPLDETFNVVVPLDAATNPALSGLISTEEPGPDDGDGIGETDVVLTSGTPINLDQDFGFTAPMNADGSIGNRVWEDQDADGIYEPNGVDGIMGTADDETPLVGVTIDLYRDLNEDGVVNPGEPKIGTTTTDMDGLYLFDNLPIDDGDGMNDGASYVVDVTDEDGILFGFSRSESPTQDPDTNSGDDDPMDNAKADPFGVTIGNGIDDNRNVDFGYFKDPAAIGNYVFNDVNGNGIQDLGDTPIEGVEVTLTIQYPAGGNPTVLTAITDMNGFYEFPNLLLDEDYRIGAGVAEGNPTTPAADMPQHTLSIETIGQEGVGEPLEGLAPTAADAQGTGQQPKDAENVNGVNAVPIQGSENTTAATTPTDASGAANEAAEAQYDFGFSAGLVGIGGTVWSDQGAGGGTQNNGMQEGGEPGIGGVLVELLDNNGDVVTSTTTNPDGTYLFEGLTPGDYQIRLPDSNFSGPLNGLPFSSVPTTIADNDDTDNDDNGLQTVGSGTVISPTYTLSVGGEPSGAAETETPTQDGTDSSARDLNTNTTVDFGFQDLVLPVELLIFKAQADKDHIDLTWSTASEKNNSHFDLERSEDGKSFKSIARIQGQGTKLAQTDYKYEDRAAIPNVRYYYRLKQMDFDGHAAYSAISTAQLEAVIGDIKLYPNPIGLDQALQVRFFAKEAVADFVIMDMNSKPVLRVKQDLNATGWATIQIKLDGLAAGNYLLMDKMGNTKPFVVVAE
ncbi:MAG: SdrD B-like domain-containing protein [Bacteroidota bacterium]